LMVCRLLLLARLHRRFRLSRLRRRRLFLRGRRLFLGRCLGLLLRASADVAGTSTASVAAKVAVSAQPDGRAVAIQ
jgi:hypothetical protein